MAEPPPPRRFSADIPAVCVTASTWGPAAPLSVAQGSPVHSRLVDPVPAPRESAWGPAAGGKGVWEVPRSAPFTGIKSHYPSWDQVADDDTETTASDVSHPTDENVSDAPSAGRPLPPRRRPTEPLLDVPLQQGDPASRTPSIPHKDRAADGGRRSSWSCTDTPESRSSSEGIDAEQVQQSILRVRESLSPRSSPSNTPHPDSCPLSFPAGGEADLSHPHCPHSAATRTSSASSITPLASSLALKDRSCRKNPHRRATVCDPKTASVSPPPPPPPALAPSVALVVSAAAYVAVLCNERRYVLLPGRHAEGFADDFEYGSDEDNWAR
eukprot:gene7887-12114_t